MWRERKRGGCSEWQSCLGVMLTAGICDDRELPWGDGRPRNSVPLQIYCVYVCVSTCEAMSVCVFVHVLVLVCQLQGVCPPVAVKGAARCIFASHCKVRAGLVAQCQNGGQEGGR